MMRLGLSAWVLVPTLAWVSSCNVYTEDLLEDSAQGGTPSGGRGAGRGGGPSSGGAHSGGHAPGGSPSGGTAGAGGVAPAGGIAGASGEGGGGGLAVPSGGGTASGGGSSWPSGGTHSGGAATGGLVTGGMGLGGLPPGGAPNSGGLPASGGIPSGGSGAAPLGGIGGIAGAPPATGGIVATGGVASGGTAAATGGIAPTGGTGTAGAAITCTSTGGVGCVRRGGPAGDYLISDFEGTGGSAKIVTLGEQRAGYWYTYNSNPATGGTGVQTPASAEQIPEVPSGETSWAAHTTGHGFSFAAGFAGIGFNLLDKGGGISCPYDASMFGGIKFRLKGVVANPPGTIRVRLPLAATVPVANGGICCATSTCRDDFGKDIELPVDWQEVTIAWTDVHQGDWGAKADWNAAQLMGVLWQFETDAANANFELWLDDVQFIPPP